MNLIKKILHIYQVNRYPIAMGEGEIDICYLEGCKADGSPNDDRINHWNDRRIVFALTGGKWKVLGNWEATTEPGLFYTANPMNPLGAARIAFGYYRAWRVGTHGNSEPHEALVQVNPVTVHRDFNKDGFRTGDKTQTGIFGINQHHGYDMPTTDIGKASAGCLVGRSRKSHRDFMSIVKSDPRYRKDKNFVFGTAVIDGSKL